MKKNKLHIIVSVVILLMLCVSASCSQKDGDNKVSSSSLCLQSNSTVYITPTGECYHSTTNCRTLKRSHNIVEADIDDVINTRRPCKICH